MKVRHASVVTRHNFIVRNRIHNVCLYPYNRMNFAFRVCQDRDTLKDGWHRRKKK